MDGLTHSRTLFFTLNRFLQCKGNTPEPLYTMFYMLFETNKSQSAPEYLVNITLSTRMASDGYW